MGVLTTTAVIPPVVRETFNRELLRRSLPRLVHMRPCARKSLKERSGDTMVFRKIESLAPVVATLIEGVPPTGKSLSKSQVTCVLEQHGDYVTISDLAIATVEHPLLNDASRVLGEQSARSLDNLTRDKMCAGSQVFYGGNVALRSLIQTPTHKIDAAVLDRATRLLDFNNASHFTEMITSSVKYNTFGIRPCYWGIAHTDVIFTLQNMAGWIPVEQYASTGPVLEAEKGCYKNIRFLETTDAKVVAGGGGAGSGDIKITGGNADVYITLIVAMDAMAIVPLEGMSLENIIHPIGSGGPADPLNQIGTSGWKSTGARVRLEDDWLVRIETAGAKDNP